MAELAARRYAKAIFELALENDRLDEYTSQLSSAFLMFGEDSELSKIMGHPDVSGDEKFSVIEKVLKGASPDILGLFRVIIKKSREHDIKSILEVFLEMSKKHKNIVTARIYSPVKLTDEKLLSVKQALSQKMNKQVEIQFELEPDLIGGIRIIADGKIIDGSIRRQLDDMKSELLNLQLALV